GILAPGNALTAFNQQLHESDGYNMFQFSISALAVFSGSAYHTMEPLQRTCFVAGTMVHTAAGLVAIERIKAGDRVTSTDADTFETSDKAVVEAYVREATTLVRLAVGGELVSTTADHPFFVEGRGFVDAGELQAGDVLRGASGDSLSVESARHEALDEPVGVYNFQVEDFHTYHVGEAGVMVHNAGGDYAPRRPIKGVIKTEVHEDGSTTYTKIVKGREVSVTYSKEGYPDFSPYAHPEHSKPVTIENSGVRSTDFRRANSAVGLDSTPKGYTWHHMENGQMLLVERAVHSSKSGFPHTGGISLFGKEQGQ
ncbi:MAG: HNH endonuclease, partial [Coriobacteriales bacterium]|nr:HNH endonuclease [Coriobacteriales bacterium]